MLLTSQLGPGSSSSAGDGPLVLVWMQSLGLLIWTLSAVEARTSFADLGHMIASSGRCCLASCSTGLGTGTALLPLPLGLPGCDTTAATCKRTHTSLACDFGHWTRRGLWAESQQLQQYPTAHNLVVRVMQVAAGWWVVELASYAPAGSSFEAW